MRTVQRIAKNTLVTTSSEVINKLLSLFIYITIANYLKAVGYGQFSFIMILLAIFNMLANFGLDKLTIREVAKTKEKTTQYLSSMIKLKLFLTSIVYIILILSIHLTGKPTTVIYGVYLVGLSLVFVGLSNTFMAIFNAHERLEINAVLLVFIKLLILGLVCFIIYLKLGILFILGVFVVGEATRSLIFWLIYRRSRYFSRVNPITSLDFKKTLVTAFPFALIGVLSLIYMHIDVVMLSLMKGDKPVGLYSAAYTLIVGLMFIPRSYTLSVYPVISRYVQGSNKLLNLSWQKSVKLLTAVSLPLTIGVILLAHRFINLFYNFGYANSAAALQVLMLAIPWIFVNAINMYLLYAADKQRQATVIVLISTAVNIILNFILIPKFSYMGAAWSTVLAEIINVYMFFRFVEAVFKFKLKILNSLLKILLAAFFMGLFIYLCPRFNLVFLILASVVLYVGLLVLFRTFDREDRNILEGILTIFRRKN